MCSDSAYLTMVRESFEWILGQTLMTGNAECLRPAVSRHSSPMAVECIRYHATPTTNGGYDWSFKMDGFSTPTTEWYAGIQLYSAFLVRYSGIDRSSPKEPGKLGKLSYVSLLEVNVSTNLGYTSFGNRITRTARVLARSFSISCDGAPAVIEHVLLTRLYMLDRLICMPVYHVLPSYPSGCLACLANYLSAVLLTSLYAYSARPPSLPIPASAE